MDRLVLKRKLLKNYINSVSWVLSNWSSKDREKVITVVKRVEQCEEQLMAIGLSYKIIGQIVQACCDRENIKRAFFKKK